MMLVKKRKRFPCVLFLLHRQITEARKLENVREIILMLDSHKVQQPRLSGRDDKAW